ncbi:MAG: T9SS type A sorting domain-containing protein, partial [Melioribacteraceae bacterium]|nr:T9SS type A sorting domain-containing protein [Melioribacteraceae bacterium]
DQGYFNLSIITDLKNGSINIPNNFIVLSNYPNPFNPSTIIYYELPKSENIEIKIFDILGREIRTLFNNFHKAGTYTIEWNGRNHWNSPVAAGIYLCRLKTKDRFKVHKMLLLDGGSSFPLSSFAQIEKPKQKNISKLISHFNFRVKVTGSNILESEFQDLSCSSDTTLNLLVSKILQTAAIGPEGGKLETEDFSLEIPSGSFSSTETLTLTVPTDEDPFRNEIVSKVFSIEGLPIEYSRSLKLKLKHNGDLSNESFILLGEEGMSPEDGKPEMIYDFINPTDSSGFLIAELPVILDDANTNKITVKKNTEGKKRILLKAVSKFLTDCGVYNTENNNYEYKIFTPLSYEYFDPKIIDFFDHAIIVITNMHLIPPDSLSIPSIYFANLSDDIYCKFAYRNAVGNRKAKGIFAINSNHFDDLETMKISICKEFLRYTLLGYDPTYPQMIDPKQEKHYWVKQALITSLETVIKGYDSEFKPRNFIGNEMAPLNGMHAGIRVGKLDAFSNAKNHGGGMSSFFRYFFEERNKDIFLTGILFSLIKEGMHPINAFHNTFEYFRQSMNETGLSNFWKKFLSDYVLNYELDYNFVVSYDNFLETIEKSNIFNIDNLTDTLKEFNTTFTDLSCKLFRININNTNVRETYAIKFIADTSTKGSSSYQIFGDKYDEYHKHYSRESNILDDHEFLITNLKDHSNIIVSVVNGFYEPPYTNTYKIKLKVKTKILTLPTKGKMTISGKFLGKYHYTSETEARDFEAEYIDHYWSGNVELINDSTYWGMYEYKDQMGYNHDGEIKVVINPFSKNLKYFEAHEEKDGDGWTVINERIVSNNLDLTMSSEMQYSWNYIEWGNDACNNVKTLEYSQGNDNYNQTLTSFSCSETSRIRVYFDFTPLN